MRLTPEAKRAIPWARAWLREEAPYEPEIVDALSERELIDDIERYYPGGWAHFECAGEPSDPDCCQACGGQGVNEFGRQCAACAEVFLPTRAQRETLSIPADVES